MLILYDTAHAKLCALTNYSDLYVEEVVSGTGSSDNITLPQLHFKYALEDPSNGKIALECYIALATDDGSDDAEYIVKEHNLKTEKNGGITWVEYVCDLNVEPLKGTPIDNFAPGSVPPDQAVNLALTGTGWEVGYCDVSRRRTAAKTYCMAFEAIEDVAKAYACEITFDSINHLVNIHQKQGADRGVYFAEQLNLKSLEVQANSRSYVTRLYPRGKDGMTISDVNGGVPYVSNYQYSTKVIGAYWIDNRYTNAADLLADSQERLDYLSKPIRAYAAEIIDLARVSDKWSLLDFRLGDWIMLVSESTGVREQQRIIKIDRYPDEPEKSTCEIANRLASLDDIILRVSDAADTIDDATDSTGMVQGNAIQVTNPDGTYSSLNAAVANVGSLIATKASITDLTAANGRIDSLVSTKADITYLQANYLTADSVKTTFATIDNLSAATADISKLKTDKLDAAAAAITYATVSSLTVANGNITSLQSDSAKIINLLSDNAGIGSLSADTVSANYAALMHGQLGDAQIGSLSVGKLLAGDISTDKFTVQSNSGNLSISKNTMHVFDANGKERVTVGLNGSDYNLTVRAADGQTTIFGASGVTHAGITDGAVDDSKVATGANINGSKIDQESLVSRINGATTLLNSSRVKYDPTGQTLTAEFQSLSSTVNSQGGTLTAQGTSIQAIQGQISSKVWESDITSAVNGIQIGGRNLAQHTSSTFCTPVTNFTGATNYCLPLANVLTDGLSVGDTVTVRLVLKYDNIVATSGQTATCWIQGPGCTTSWNSGAFYGSESLTLNGSGQHEFLYNFGVSADQLKNSCWLAQLRTDYIQSGSVQWKSFEVERGTKIPDWSPAPEDVQSQIDTHSSEIAQNTSDISLRVLSSTYNSYTAANDSNISNLQSRMSSAELKIDPSAITATVASNITGNQIASIINQTASALSIDASKINMHGFVTMTDLSTPGATTISGSNVDTATLRAQKLYGDTSGWYEKIGAVSILKPNWDGSTITCNGVSLYDSSNVLCGGLYSSKETDCLLSKTVFTTTVLANNDGLSALNIQSCPGAYRRIRLSCNSEGTEMTQPQDQFGMYITYNPDDANNQYAEIYAQNVSRKSSMIIKPDGITGLVDYVSNGAGEAWKFGDGLMICTAIMTMATGDDSCATWNYPVAFASNSVPYVSTPSLVVGANGLVGTNITYINNIGVVLQFIKGSFSPIGATLIGGVRLTAIGRWKN